MTRPIASPTRPSTMPSTRHLPFSILTAICLMVSPAAGQDQEAPAVQDPVSYFLGYSVGQSFSQQGFTDQDVTIESIGRGMKDALSGSDPVLSTEQLVVAQGRIQAMLQKRQQEMMAEQEQAGAMNKEKSELFLTQTAKEDGVKKLDGGLLYKVLQEGDGESPTAADTVTVHYTGKLIDGTVFDSSVQRGEPATFQVGAVIQGWQMALQQMKVGSKWMLYIPPDLAYGESGRPPKIGPNEALVFEVELLEVR